MCLVIIIRGRRTGLIHGPPTTWSRGERAVCGRTDLRCQHPAPSHPRLGAVLGNNAFPFRLVEAVSGFKSTEAVGRQDPVAPRETMNPTAWAWPAPGGQTLGHCPGPRASRSLWTCKWAWRSLSAACFCSTLVFVFFLTNSRFAVSKMKRQLPVGRRLNACGCLFSEEFACRNCFL